MTPAPHASGVPGTAPLHDLRIIAVEQYGAGPFGSLQLAELGAEVIKIEDPHAGGDVGRAVPPHAAQGDSLFFETFNRNKRSITLDLDHPEGRGVFERLVRVSDVVYSNLRGDVPAKLRITYDDLKHLNPRIVCVSLSGFGMSGPRMTEPGYDYILQGLAGWMSLTGDPEGPPTKSGLSLVDYSAGLAAATSLLAGVHAARRDGVGMDCDVSLYDTAVGMLSYVATWNLTAGVEPTRMPNSAHPSLVPFQAFRARDGWFTVACAKEKFWRRLAVVVGHPEWTTPESGFADFAGRRERSRELLAMLDELFLERTVSEWVEALRAAGVPCGEVRTVKQALEDEHARERGLVVETEHPRFGIVRQPAAVVRVGERPAVQRRAPRLNEDETYVLREVLDLEDDKAVQLSTNGAFGPR